MRARAHTEPVTVTPVAKVVPAALAGTGPVRDLVVAEALTAQELLGELVQRRDAVVIRLRRGRASPPALDGPPTGARPVGDGLLRLERELQRIAGEVIGPQRGRSLEVFAPGRRRLPGPAEDEVQVDVETDRPRGRDRWRDVRRLVRSAQST